MRARLLLMVLLSLLAVPSSLLAASSNAVDRVALGIRHFEAGDYAAASEAFAEAEAAEPDNKRIAFDRACAYAAGGDDASAIEWFQKAVLAEDLVLAARCHYNLGCLDVDKAKKLFGESPEEAAPEVRAEGVELLQTAIAHFRDAMAVSEDDAVSEPDGDARHNLEAARLWIRRMEELWRQRDRAIEREKMDLVQYLGWLDQQQRGLRGQSKSLGAATNSPKHRQAVYETETDQRRLAEEIGPLKAKIHASLQPPAAGQPAAPGAAPQPQTASQPNVEKAVEMLGGLADNAGKAMLAAADLLGENAPTTAVGTQADVVEKLDQVYMVAAPYTNLVQHAIDAQQGLVDESTLAIEPAKPTENEATQPDEQPQDGQSEDSTEKPPVDLAESAWNQGFVTRWSEMILAKAEQGLRNMPPPQPAPQDVPEDVPAAVPQDEHPPAAPPAADTPTDDSPQKPDPAQAAREQQEALREAMQKAVELAPKVKTLTSEAAHHLKQQDPAEALPKQEEALKLLKEMLPKQPQQQNQQQDQQQNQDQKDQDNQDKQDQNQQDQKKDQDKKNQEKKDAEKDKDKDKGEKDKKDEKEKQQDQKDQQKQDQQKQQQAQQPRQPRDVSEQQAEALLRKARQQQAERRKLEKILQMQLYRPGKVEKDW